MKDKQGYMMIRDEHGGSLVEFAVIAPLLFVILFGIIEFGILIYDKAVITNASREGARAGIVFDYDDGGTPSDSADDTFHPDDATIVEAVDKLLRRLPHLLRCRIDIDYRDNKDR